MFISNLILPKARGFILLVKLVEIMFMQKLISEKVTNLVFLIFWNNNAKYDRIEKIEYRRNTTEFKKIKIFNY
jgi:hypothetical protein